jgi:hypothetical protein
VLAGAVSDDDHSDAHQRTLSAIRQ